MGNTFDKIKRAFRGTAEKTTDSAQKVADPDASIQVQTMQMKIEKMKKVESNR